MKNVKHMCVHALTFQHVRDTTMKLLLALMGVGALASAASSEKEEPEYEAVTVVARSGRSVTVVRRNEHKFCVQNTNKCFSPSASRQLERFLKRYGF